MNKLSLIGSCQQVVIIILKCHYKSHDRNAACFALHRVISLLRVIDLVVEDVFKKEMQKIVSFFKCEEGTETENLKSMRFPLLRDNKHNVKEMAKATRAI